MYTTAKGVAVAAFAVTLAAGFSGTALGSDAPYVEETEISKAEARSIARQFLSDLGFTAPSQSSTTAMVRGAELDGDTWRVKVRLGMISSHIRPERGVVLVNAETGEIDGY